MDSEKYISNILLNICQVYFAFKKMLKHSNSMIYLDYSHLGTKASVAMKPSVTV